MLSYTMKTTATKRAKNQEFNYISSLWKREWSGIYVLCGWYDPLLYIQIDGYFFLLFLRLFLRQSFPGY